MEPPTYTLTIYPWSAVPRLERTSDRDNRRLVIGRRRRRNGVIRAARLASQCLPQRTSLSACGISGAGVV
jgi:hypothetical protein